MFIKFYFCYRVDHTALTFPCAIEPSRSLPLVFEDICVSINKKEVLKDVSGVVRWVFDSLTDIS